ncbi:CU044_2847 family protein [Kitasatospora sp. NPDC058965]|uniref:CU044_2847 family protein n=1 Tax=Kitasatospora sp. NPDC058965 TaxID=3346682 RepID=UPI003676CDB2
MTYLVELPIGGAGDPSELVQVEIDQAGSDGLVQVARPGQVVARATRSMGEMLAGIRPVAEHFVENFRGMVQAPDTIGVEFGLSLSAAADVVISSTAATANFKVTLTWNRSAHEGSSAAPDPAPAVPSGPSAP